LKKKLEIIKNSIKNFNKNKKELSEYIYELLHTDILPMCIKNLNNFNKKNKIILELLSPILINNL